MPITARQLRALIDDPAEFIPLLSIIDENGKSVPFDDPNDEQVELLDVLQNYRNVYIVKPRQIGCSTLVRAYNFWYGYRCRDPIRELIVSHEADSTAKMHQANKEFLDSLARLDPGLARPLRTSNRIELIFEDTGVRFRCLTAGGVGGGKSWTYQRAHLTEVGSWPQGTADSLWASLDATQHPGPHYQRIVESTGHGSGTFFADLIDKAAYDETAKIVFFPWFKHTSYTASVPPDFERTDEERDLSIMYHLTDAQLQWRRLKLKKTTPLEFRHNYPMNLTDAFMDEGGSYFPNERMSWLVAGTQNVKALYEREGLRIFKKPTPGTRYVLGVDAASGIGQDFAAVQILSEDYEQVGVYHSNRCKPEELAELVAQLGAAYNNALVIVEGKGSQGGVTLFRLKQLRYNNLWVDELGREWDTNYTSKCLSYSHARSIINDGGLRLNDLMTVKELMTIEQVDNHAPEAPKGKHDDLSDALVFALWALRYLTATHIWTRGRELAFASRMKRLAGHPY